MRLTDGNGEMMRIMIVDNDPIYLGLLSEVLRLHGYEVISAFDGQDAMEKLRRHPVDFIISDISMPRMNGTALHRCLRDDGSLRNIPFAWNSSYRELRDSVEVAEPGLDLKLDKAMPVPNLLFFLGHFATRLRNSARTGESLPC
jgi:CheY-like chemotaxis protein